MKHDAQPRASLDIPTKGKQAEKDIQKEGQETKGYIPPTNCQSSNTPLARQPDQKKKVVPG